MSNVVDFEKLKDAQYAFLAKTRCKRGALAFARSWRSDKDRRFYTGAKLGCTFRCAGESRLRHDGAGNANRSRRSE
jgi:hypothetical protein